MYRISGLDIALVIITKGFWIFWILLNNEVKK